MSDFKPGDYVKIIKGEGNKLIIGEIKIVDHSDNEYVYIVGSYRLDGKGLGGWAPSRFINLGKQISKLEKVIYGLI